jgi:osmotically-inducible protein OsmY
MQVAQRFQSNFATLARTNPNAGTVNIRVDNGTAVVSGSVVSEDAKNHIVSMLRLEPGIYRIDDQQLSIQQ